MIQAQRKKSKSKDKESNSDNNEDEDNKEGGEQSKLIDLDEVKEMAFQKWEEERKNTSRSSKDVKKLQKEFEEIPI